MTQGHRGQGLTQDAQVVLRQAYSLLNRTNQIGRKQVAGAMHMPSPLPAVDIWHLWTPQFMCSYWAMFSFCTHPAMLMTERGENLTTIQNLSRKSQGITKMLALWASVCCKSPWSSWNASCALLLNPHNIKGLITHQDKLPLRPPLHLCLWFLNAFILNNMLIEWIREHRKISQTVCSEGVFHTLGLTQDFSPAVKTFLYYFNNNQKKSLAPKFFQSLKTHSVNDSHILWAKFFPLITPKSSPFLT